MGYDTSNSPPRKWFAGRLYINYAATCTERRHKDSPLAIDDIVDLFEAKLNLLRAIRAALGMPPDHGRSFQNSLDEMKGHLSEQGYLKLSALTMAKHTTSVGGTGQYGVPNFDITNNQTGESAAATDCSSPIFQQLIKIAYDERLANVKAIAQCLRDLFFDEVYLPGKKHDMFYYHPAEYMSDDEFYDYVIKRGFAKTREEAEASYPDKYEPVESPLQQCFRNDIIRHYKEIHHSSFFSFEERDSIRHGFSD